MLETRSYDNIVGNTKDMPYLKSLASNYACAKEYYDNTHPSIGNYFMLATGQIITNDDRYSKTISANNLVRQFIKTNKTWREYSEDIPYVGYIGKNKGGYIQRHNPLSYFSDVQSSSTQKTKPCSTLKT